MRSMKNLILIATLAATSAIAGTTVVQVPTTVVAQPKGPVRAWQLLFDNRYSFYTSPSTLGFYKDLASCERVKSQMWADVDGRPRSTYHRFICVEVDLP